MKKIELHTKLHKGIYKSCGGGEDRTVETWNIGPRNLLRSIRALRKERSNNTANFGNVGCGASWLQIGDLALDPFDLEIPEDKLTDWAKEILKRYEKK